MGLLHHSMTFWLAEGKMAFIRYAALDFELLTANKLKSIDSKIRELGRKRTPEKQELLDERFAIYETLHQNIRYSLFIAAYSQFEQALTDICNDYTERFALPITLNDLAGKGVIRCQSYLKKVVGVSFPDDEPEWKRILNLGKLRNHLVHSGLWILEDENRELSNIVATEKYLSGGRDCEVYFAKNFVPHVTELFESFLSELTCRSLSNIKTAGQARKNRISLKRIKRRLARGVIDHKQKHAQQKKRGERE